MGRQEANITLYGAGSDLTDLVSKIQDVFGEYAKELACENPGRMVLTLPDDTQVRFYITEDMAEMTKQTIGMADFFMQSPVKNQQVKDAAIHQIRLFTCIIGISFELTDDKNRTNFIAGSVHELASRITAFVLYPDMHLYHPNGKLLISIQGETDYEEYYAVMCKSSVLPDMEENDKDKARKLKSIEILKSMGIPYIEHMSVSAYDESSVIPDKEQVLLRAIAVFACSVKSEVYTCGRYDDVVLKTSQELEMLEEQYGFMAAASAEEKAYIADKEPEQVTMNNFGWRYECCAVLLWALNLLEMKEPTEICDAQELGGIIWNNDFKSLMDKAVLRGKDEILDFQDLVYRYDWACVECRIKHKELPMLNEEIVREWHYALNWLSGAYGVTDWDNVPVNT